LQLHYIFINPYNLREVPADNPTFLVIRDEHRRYYDKINELRVTYWSYQDIAVLLDSYDKGLYALYLQINPRYAALLSDIGRFIILYNHGGVYHDLKFIAKPKFLKALKRWPNQYSLIGEQHPKHNERVRSGNLISFKRYLPFFEIVLQSIKERLLEVQRNNLSGSKLMFELGSGLYIQLFAEYEKKKADFTKMRLDCRYLKYSKTIYKANIVKWQGVEEQILI
jgi:hypothetical protein